MATAAQILANQQNAKLSSGPKTESGKAALRLNAVKTGLTGQIVLLASDDAAAYQAHIDRHFNRYSPATDEEHTLVQFLADTEWRLLRISPLESAIWAKGKRELAEAFADESDPTVREGLIRLTIMDTYRKDLSNLALQERRLRNHYKSDLDRLQALQAERIKKEKDAESKLFQKMVNARTLLKENEAKNQIWDPSEFGFEFSVEEIAHYWAEHARYFKFHGVAPVVSKVLAAFRNAQKAGQAA